MADQQETMLQLPDDHPMVVAFNNWTGTSPEPAVVASIAMCWSAFSAGCEAARSMGHPQEH